MSKALLVSAEINGRVHQRLVSIEVKKSDKGFCTGKVGDFFFMWRPSKHNLPMLSLNKKQEKLIYEGLTTPEEKAYKLELTRKQIHKFLVNYKIAKSKMSAPTKLDVVPDGFHVVDDDPFVFEMGDDK